MAGDDDSVEQFGKNLIPEHFSRLGISNPEMKTNDIGFKDLLEEDRYRVESLFNKQISFCCACAPSRSQMTIKSSVTFCSFRAMASFVVHYSTHAQQN